MDLAHQLFAQLQELPQVEAIALGGSRASGLHDARSDYDVYLYCTAPIDEEARRALLARYCTVMEIGNHYWEYEDNCTFRDGVDLDLLHRVPGRAARCDHPRQHALAPRRTAGIRRADP